MRLVHFFEMTKEQTVPNPMPHVGMDDPRMGDWYDRGEAIVNTYMKEKGDEWSPAAWKQASADLAQVMDVPMDQIIGTETHLEPEGLERGEGDKFSSSMPLFYFIDGIYMVVDGNHRTVQAFLKGDKSVRGMVINVDAAEQQMAA